MKCYSCPGNFSLKIVQKLRYFVIVSVLFIFHWDLIAYDMRNIIMKYNIYDWLEIELQISNIRTFDRRLPSVYVTLFVLMAFDKPVFPNFRWCFCVPFLFQIIFDIYKWWQTWASIVPLGCYNTVLQHCMYNLNTVHQLVVKERCHSIREYKKPFAVKRNSVDWKTWKYQQNLSQVTWNLLFKALPNDVVSRRPTQKTQNQPERYFIALKIKTL